ncbi:MAG: FHA domain-containing protein, partial [Ilumatobacteraceae bacterium]
QASRQHAEIRYENGRHIVADLNSTNGTLVNDQRINGSQPLNHGDIITIGSTEFRYETS